MKPKRGHILIFSDHRGIRRFFLRVHGTADELQLWMERQTHRSKMEDWACITWDDC
jgi:hypothetical protein